MKNNDKYYNLHAIINKNGYGKGNWELRKEVYKLNEKIDNLYNYIYNIQKYLTDKEVQEINEKYGDLLNED